MTFAPWTALALSCAALAATVPSIAAAQTASTPVATHGDWGVHVADDPKECYMVSAPTASKATRDGQPVEVNRGDIRLYVRFSPSENVSNEFSFLGGYVFRQGSSVEVKVGDDTFGFTPGSGDAGGWAWSQPSDDSAIAAAMKRGSTALVTGTSSRGNTTVDTFSLKGFTAAAQDAAGRCK